MAEGCSLWYGGGVSRVSPFIRFFRFAFSMYWNQLLQLIVPAGLVYYAIESCRLNLFWKAGLQSSRHTHFFIRLYTSINGLKSVVIQWVVPTGLVRYVLEPLAQFILEGWTSVLSKLRYRFPYNRLTYLPITSNSKLITVPIWNALKLVCSYVYGIIATLNWFCLELTTVKPVSYTHLTLPTICSV